MLTESQTEQIRNQFFKRTNIDLFNLEPDEIHELLTLLPLALVYLHSTYFIAVGSDDPTDYMSVEACKANNI
jgi:hypothetical protein